VETEPVKRLVSIVIPAYNEEAVLAELKVRLQEFMGNQPSYDFEVVIVENGSYDKTYERLLGIHREDSRFKIVKLSRNFGPDEGIVAGLRYVHGHAAIIMDADLQDPPELIHQFIQKWEEGYEIVYGIIQKREGVSSFRKVISRGAYWIIHKLSNDLIPENACDFRLIDRKVYRALARMNEKNKFLRGLIVWTGFRQVGIPFERHPRFAGEPKAGFRMAWDIAMNGIFSFSYFPLKIATAAGFLLFGLSCILTAIEIYLYLIYGREVPGFTTLVLSILFGFGMVFLMFGVLGNYIERIYEEVKQRPNYIVDTVVGFNEPE